TYYIETGHLRKMLTCLREGDTAVDVGASVGVMTASLSRTVGPHGQVFAFEPARRAHALLRQTLHLNHLENVIAENLAVSDRKTQTEFLEYKYDPKNQVAWQPEASAMVSPYADENKCSEKYLVET